MMVNVRQRDGDGMTAGTGSSGVRGDAGEESEVPFDPEATGIIPRLDLESVKETPPSGSADPKASPPPDPPEPEDDSAGDDEDASATMTFRIPTSAAVRIGGPPTLDEQAPTDEQAKDPASAEEQGKEPGPAGKPAKKSAAAGKRAESRPLPASGPRRRPPLRSRARRRGPPFPA